MEQEKIKEIKKALNNCQKNNCIDCPYFIDEKRCKANDLLLDTINLINELESENERLRNAKVVYENVDYCYEDLKKAEKKIAELEKGNEALSFAVKQGFNDCQAKTLKQFAERLKEKSQKAFINVGGLTASAKSVTLHDIDETLKEFL